MGYGYSQYTVEANKRANRQMLGVALGRLCIAHGVPVAAVAKKLGVSRQTVYNWFEGKHEPDSKLNKPINAFVLTLTNK